MAVKQIPTRPYFSRSQFTTVVVNGLERDVYMAGHSRPVFRISQRWGKGAGWWVMLPNRDHYLKGRHKSITKAIMAGAEKL